MLWSPMLRRDPRCAISAGLLGGRTMFLIDRLRRVNVAYHFALYCLMMLSTIIVHITTPPLLAGVPPTWWLFPLGAILVAGSSLLADIDAAPASILRHLLVVLVLTPSMVLTVRWGLSLTFPIATVLSFALLAAASRVTLPNWRFGFLPEKWLLWGALGASVFYTMAHLFLFAGLENINFDVSKVYAFREGAEAQLPGWMSYLRGAVSGALLPIATALALRSKNAGLVAVCLVTALLIFGVTSHKSAVAYPLLVCLAYFLATRSRPVLWLVLAVALALVVSAITHVLDFGLDFHPFGIQPRWVAAIVLRRALLTTAMLNSVYLDYFASSPDRLYWWSNSRITFGMIPAPSELSPPLLIGKEVFWDETLAANTGFFGSGIANASYLGLAIYSVGVGLFLSIVNWVAARQGSAVAVAALAVPFAIIGVASDLLTALLSHGAGLALILLMATRPRKDMRA